MKRKEMIKNNKIFNNMINNASFKKGKYYILYYASNNEDNSKFGIAISKKYGNAVERNLIKRQTRTIVDNNRLLFKNTENYIIMIKKNAPKVKYQELEIDLVTILKERNIQ